MVLAGLISVSVLAAQSKSQPPTLDFLKDRFVARVAGKTAIATIEPTAPPRQTSTDRIQYRKDDAFVVWDSRGLSIRHAEKVITTRMGDIPFSPKIWDKDAIARHRLLLANGAMRREARHLLAARRFGGHVYMIFQWEDTLNRPLFEALVWVNLDAPVPKAEPLLRLNGGLVQAENFDNRMPILQGKIVFLESDGTSWGAVSLDPAKQTTSRKNLGEALEDLRMVSPRQGVFVERNGHGSKMLGRFDLISMQHRHLAEVKGQLRLIDGQSPWIAHVLDDTGEWVQNLETGARFKLETGQRARRLGANVVIWKGDLKPTEAKLLDPKRWDFVAGWKAKVEPAKPAAKPTPKPPTKPTTKPTARPRAKRP